MTSHIGLVGTLNATFNEPYELARKLASLDHLSGGRAGWNVVTSFDAYTGANFRRGGFLEYAQRYERAEETVATVRELWDVGTPASVADQLDDFIQQDGADGVVLGSHLVPAGLDEFVDRVVPLLQERGSLRTDYEGTTLRDNLGLPLPVRGEGRVTELVG